MFLLTFFIRTVHHVLDFSEDIIKQYYILYCTIWIIDVCCINIDLKNDIILK